MRELSFCKTDRYHYHFNEMSFDIMMMVLKIQFLCYTGQATGVFLMDLPQINEFILCLTLSLAVKSKRGFGGYHKRSLCVGFYNGAIIEVTLQLS